MDLVKIHKVKNLSGHLELLQFSWWACCHAHHWHVCNYRNTEVWGPYVYANGWWRCARIHFQSWPGVGIGSSLVQPASDHTVSYPASIPSFHFQALASFWLFHICLLTQIAMQKCSFNIHLVDVPIEHGANMEDCVHGFHPSNRCIRSYNRCLTLRKAFRYEHGLQCEISPFLSNCTGGQTSRVLSVCQEGLDHQNEGPDMMFFEWGVLHPYSLPFRPVLPPHGICHVLRVIIAQA